MGRLELSRVLYAEFIKKRWTMDDLAKRADVPRTALTDLFFTEKPVDPALVQKVSAVLGVADGSDDRA